MSRFALRYPFFIIMLCMIVAVVGSVTVARMPVDLFPEIKIPVAFVTSAELVDDWLTVDTLTIEPEERRISILAKAEVPLTDGPESLGRIIIGEMGPETRAAVEEGRELPGKAGA